MRWRRVSIGLTALALGGLGYAAGQWLAHAEATRFDVADWPARGTGPRLVEYYDPSCAGSRAVHLRLVELLGDPPGVEHVLVPVAIGRGAAAAPADVLCAMPPAEAFVTATRWAERGGAEKERRADERVAACARIVERATRHTAELSAEGIAETPIVELGGRVYVGQRALPEIEAALREVRR